MSEKIVIQTLCILLALFLFSFDSPAQTNERPIEVGGFLTVIDLRDSVAEKPLGIGGRFTYNFTDNLALDSEVSYFPEGPGPGGNYGQTIALAGMRAGIRGKKFGAFAKVRPGVARFGGATFRAFNESQSHFALDVGGVVEFYPNSRVIVRIDVGDTIIPFGNAAINGPIPPYAIRPGTTHNLQSSFGIGFRF